MEPRVKKTDVGRVLNIALSALALIAVLVQGGRILERTESTKQEIVDLINHNEKTRDLKDDMKVRELADLGKKLDEEISNRKKSDERLDKMRDLMLVRFGQQVIPEKEK